MRCSVRVLVASVLVGLNLCGCMLPPTATPVPVATGFPRPTSVAEATQAAPTQVAPLTPAPEPTQVDAPPTAVAQPTALAEPAIVGHWQLSDLPAMGRYPMHIAVLADTILVTNDETRNVSIIRDNIVVGAVPVPGDIRAAVADPDRDRVYVACGTYEKPAIAVVSPDGGSTLWSVPAPPERLTLAGDTLAAVAMDPTRILLLETDSGQIKKELAVSDAHWIEQIVGAPGSDRLFVYVDNIDTGSLLAYDISTGEQIDQADVPSGIRALALSPDATRLYAVVYGWGEGNYALALDAATLATLARTELPAAPYGLAVSPMSGHLAVLLGEDTGAWILDADLEMVMDVPFVGAASCAAYGDLDILYAASSDENTVTVYNPILSSWPPTIALAAQYGGLAVDPINGRVLLSLANEDQILVLDQHGAEQGRWATGNAPQALTVWPGQGTVAVIERDDDKIALLDQAGNPVARYPTNPSPGGVTIDTMNHRIIAGGTMVNTLTDSTRGLTTTVYLNTEATPSKTYLDTRRQRLYGLVNNGIPGSNGGNIIRLLDAPAETTGPDEIGWRSVSDAAYDEEHDQFMVGWGHMSTYGLAVVNAETGHTVHNLTLDGYPTAMALNPASRHLWIATMRTGVMDEAPSYQLLGYDTRTMARIRSLEMGVRIDLMAVDPNLMRIYLASEEAGALFILQDVVDRAAAAPPGPATATPLPTHGPIPTLPPPPTSAPVPTPCALAPHPVLALVAPVGGAGCPLDPGASTSLAVQTFEHGRMIWREDTGEIMVLQDSGALLRIEDTWQESMPDHACDAGSAPEGLWQPIRGFGLVWCQTPGLRSDLGWATHPEEAAVGIAQRYATGEFLHIDGTGTVLMTNQGAWQAIAP